LFIGENPSNHPNVAQIGLRIFKPAELRITARAKLVDDVIGSLKLNTYRTL